jgi:tetratricopeptide (TPR) repeat protein
VTPPASSLPHARHAGLVQQFQEAAALHGRGRLWEAAQAYQSILKQDDRHFDAAYRLGLIRLQQGKFDEGEALFRRAVKIDKRSADAHFHLAAALTGLGQPEKAVRHLEKALSIKPGFAEAHNNLGYALQRLDRHDEAATHYEQALALVPAYAEAHNNLGNALQMLARSDEAVTQLEKALAIRPNYAEAHNNLGNLLGVLGRTEDAIAHHQKAIAIRPTYAEAHHGLGNALSALERYGEAIEQYQMALAINPNYAEAHNSFGKALEALDRPDEAAIHYQQAIAIKADYAEAHVHMGNANWTLGRTGEALACFERAVAIEPDLYAARWNRGIAYLGLGDWAKGWKDYEWRWKKQPRSADLRDFSQPLWLGNGSLAGRRILLHAEQGFGDALMVARYLPLVAAAGAEVILEVPRPLEPLLAELRGVSRIVVRDEETLPAFDLHCPLMSLPLAFGTTLETIPGEVPYLEAQSERLIEWQRLLGDRRLPRIGISWHGNARPDPKRSIPIEAFAEVCLPQVELISLHRDIPEADRKVLPQHGIQYFGDEIRDFSDTAALIELMDVVITIDTSVAHLAGAMGKKTWILLPRTADWRWLLHREDCVWYPTARLLRQPAAGDWQSVIARVKDELATNLADLPQ